MKTVNSPSLFENIRHVPDLPVQFVSTVYDGPFLSLIAGFVRRYLKEAMDLKPVDFQRRIEHLEKFGLLEFTVPRQADLNSIEIEVKDGGSVRKVRTARTTIQYGFDKLNWGADRESLNDPNYLQELSGIVAYKLALELLPASNPVEQLILLRLDYSTFYSFLKDCHRGHLKASVLAERIGLAKVAPLVEGLEAFRVFDELEGRLAAVAEADYEDFSRRLGKRLDEMVAESKLDWSQGAIAPEPLSSVKESAAKSGDGNIVRILTAHRPDWTTAHVDLADLNCKQHEFCEGHCKKDEKDEKDENQ